MTHLLDSNAVIEAVRGKNPHIRHRLTAAQSGSVVVCSVVVGELRFGAERSANPPAEHAKLAAFLGLYPSLPYDDPAAEEYARIAAHLAATGLLIDQSDKQIAGIARQRGLTVVTHNTQHFSRVPGLQTEDWQVP